MSRRRGPAEAFIDAIAAFLSAEATGAVVLLGATVTAVAWANSPYRAGYEALWGTTLGIHLGSVTLLSLDLRHWVNDALMALFFFVVGLEIKRELAEGELSDRGKALLPALAALGGMLVPAAIYAALNADMATFRGWGIPMATDIAFAIGVLSLFGRRVPRGLVAFLLALAIADDIGAVLVIAAFYTSGIDIIALAVAMAALAGVLLMWRIQEHWSDPPLVLLMLLVWFATLSSGVHTTIAGVALGLLAPVAAGPGKLGVAERLETTFHPWTSYVVVPLFALANAGVVIDPAGIGGALASPVGLGVALGLVVGKPLGIVGASWLAVRSGVAALPGGIGWRQVMAVSAVAGIGFTVSLFIAQLALADTHLDQAKVGIFAGSLVSAAFGSALLWRWLPRRA